MVSQLITDLRRVKENVRRKRVQLISDIKNPLSRMGRLNRTSQPIIQKEKMKRLEDDDWEYVVSYSLPEECLAIDTNRAVCYQGCSNINPHLADTCLDIYGYDLKCPTYVAIQGGRE